MDRALLGALEPCIRGLVFDGEATVDMTLLGRFDSVALFSGELIKRLCSGLGIFQGQCKPAMASPAFPTPP